MIKTFKNCEKLIILNLSNFISNIINIDKNCIENENCQECKISDNYMCESCKDSRFYLEKMKYTKNSDKSDGTDEISISTLIVSNPNSKN